MTEYSRHAAVRPQEARSATIVPDPVSVDFEASTGDPVALRDDAATLEYIARRWARVLPSGRTDARADIALLRMIAGNARGYASTMEGTAA